MRGRKLMSHRGRKLVSHRGRKSHIKVYSLKYYSRDEPDDSFDMFNRDMEMSLCGGLHADIDRDEFDKYKA